MIYVGDLLARYQPDALRYFICAAGPETSDADFTWADFVHAHQLRAGRRLGQPGQPDRDHDRQELRRDPGPPASSSRSTRPCWTPCSRGFDTVGDLIGRHRQRAAIAEAMRVVGEVNKYLTVTEPYKMKDECQRERLGTVLHVAAQCVLDCNTLLAPFLPHSSNQVWAAYGGEGEFMPMPRIEQVEDLDPDDGAGLAVYPIITGDYSGTPAWERRPVVAGTPVAKPTPIFTKLDPASSTRSWPASPPTDQRRARVRVSRLGPTGRPLRTQPTAGG